MGGPVLVLRPRIRSASRMKILNVSDAGTDAATSSWRKQYTKCPSPTIDIGGISVRQRSITNGQREARKQPFGKLMGLGISPFRLTLLSIFRCGCGSRTDERRPLE